MVCGELGEQTVSDIAPNILELRLSQAPITVFINSTGGDPRAVDYIYHLLSTRAPTGTRPRIITVAIGNVASAAANLLAIGDYAIAYPRSSIYFHGLRFPEVEEVTMEYASSMARQLQLQNRETASLLAKAGTVRLAFHFARLKGNFGTIRTVCNKPDLSDVECLALSLQELLSINSKRIIDKAVKRWKWLRELSSTIMPRVIASGKTGIDFGGSVLGRLVAYEVRRLKRRAATELSEDATSEIFSNWLLLREYDMGGHMQILRTIAKRFAAAFFTPEQLVQIKAEPNAPASETIVSGVMTTAIKPFCYFASCIWDALQEDENPLSTRDAYALGVIDEVYDSGLPCLRDTMESQTPQQPNLPMPSSSGPAPPSVQS